MPALNPRPLQIAALIALAASPAVAFADERRGRASVSEISSQLEEANRQLDAADNNLKLVESQWTQRPEPTDDEAKLRRFSDAEIQYLLGDYKNAAVLFYDLVSDERFKQNDKYLDALYYLADSLYQQKNFIGAQLYLRELLSQRQGSGRYREALSRYLETAGKLNQFQGIDRYIDEAKAQPGGLSPELSYVYGKWMFKRSDLPKNERLARAQEIFEPLAADPSGAYRLQSRYFLGVVAVQRAKEGEYAEAIEQFKKIAASPAANEREQQVRELANLSLGRLFYEMGKYDEALDRYQEIPRESENFVDSLYEIAWVHVRKGEWERAKNATDILLLVAPDSTLAPEAQILQGHLQLKLRKYGEASETYNGVINTYGPVRDEIEALLTVNKDPVAYFDKLLDKSERNLDVASLLPPVALKWATTQREVADAVHVVGDIESGRKGVDESQEIASRIIKALDEKGLEAFPALQEGYTRADAVDSALTQTEQQVVRLEGYAVESQLTPEQKARYDQLRTQAAELQKRIADLPTTPEQVEARKKRMQERVDEIDRNAFKLGYELQSEYAILAAMEKWLDDTRSHRHSSPEDEKAFAEQLRQEREALNGHQHELEQLRQLLLDEKNNAEAAISGEDTLKKEYADLLSQERALLGGTPAASDAQPLMTRAEQIRSRLQGLKDRVAASKAVIRGQVERRGAQIRQKVAGELALLKSYNDDVGQISGNARNLVGRIALDSFRRVHRQFYDLVLKADVGIVDVAFTRKQDKTSEIQNVSAQKDRELHALDEEFKEVLKDVD